MEGEKDEVFTVKFLYFSISLEISLYLPANEVWDSGVVISLQRRCGTQGSF